MNSVNSFPHSKVMPSNIRYLKYWFLGLVLVGCTAVAGYDFLYGIPQRKCDAVGSWWRWQDRTCYKPIYLPTLTHRKPGEGTVVDWHDKKAPDVAGATGSASAPGAAAK